MPAVLGLKRANVRSPNEGGEADKQRGEGWAATQEAVVRTEPKAKKERWKKSSQLWSVECKVSPEDDSPACKLRLQVSKVRVVRAPFSVLPGDEDEDEDEDQDQDQDQDRDRSPFLFSLFPSTPPLGLGRHPSSIHLSPLRLARRRLSYQANGSDLHRKHGSN